MNHNQRASVPAQRHWTHYFAKLILRHCRFAKQQHQWSRQITNCRQNGLTIAAKERWKSA
jgi:hypothetical protein